jgi:hypothetical protein
MAGACAPSPNTTTVLHSAFIDVTDCGCVCSVRIDGVFYPWCRGGAALAGATPQPRPVLISAGPLTGATSSLPALSSAPAPAYRGSRQQRCERYLGITSSRHHQPQSHALDWVTRSEVIRNFVTVLSDRSKRGYSPPLWLALAQAAPLRPYRRQPLRPLRRQPRRDAPLERRAPHK